MAIFGGLSTGRLAAACARHPWRTIGAWLALMVIAIFVISRLLGSATTTEIKFTNHPESGQGLDLMEQKLRGPDKLKEIVTVSSQSATVDDSQFRQQVEKLTADINALGPDVTEGAVSYYQTNDPSMVSADRHTTIVPVVLTGLVADSAGKVEKLRDVTHAEADSSGLQILTSGTASSGYDSNQLSKQDMSKAELYGFLFALVILVIVFGALVATGLPLLLAAFSIVVALGLTAAIGQAFQLSFYAVNMITMMGMAVGIDYSLFVVSRFREELARGRGVIEAIEVAGNTASRAVLFSAMTVMLALAGMLIVPISIFYSLAIGAMLVVAASMLAALTLLPALLRLAGHRINGFVHFRKARSGQERGFWYRFSGTVMRHPIISVLAAIAVLATPALAYFSINTGASGIEAMPESLESRQGYDVLTRDFSFGLLAPIEVVVNGDTGSQQVKQAVSRLENEISGDGAFYGKPKFEVNDAGDLGVVTLPVSSYPTSEQSIDAVKHLRQDYIPQAFNGVDANVMVSGAPAVNLDYFQLTDNYRPIVFAFVLGLSFLLLMLVFHSIVVPLKAILMNLLSVGAAYGIIVLVFQKGYGASLLGFQQVPMIDAWLPLFLFSVLFGLSMDYHVFLLGRIREHYKMTGDNTAAVATGLQTTGRIITGAALIMVVVFSGFAHGGLVMFQQMGFGMAVAILLDATVVRSILVPASMRLLGDWNWYLPKWLRWLPDLKVDGGVGQETAQEGQPREREKGQAGLRPELEGAAD